MSQVHSINEQKKKKNTLSFFKGQRYSNYLHSCGWGQSEEQMTFLKFFNKQYKTKPKK